MVPENKQKLIEERQEENREVQQVAGNAAPRQILTQPGSDIDPDYIRAFALAYAKYLEANNLTPDDIEIKPEEKQLQAADDTDEAEKKLQEVLEGYEYEDESEEEALEVEAKPKIKAKKTKRSKARDKKVKIAKPKVKSKRSLLAQSVLPEITDEEIEYYQNVLQNGEPLANAIASITNVYDRARDEIASFGTQMGKDFVIETHRIVSAYNHSRKTIGVVFLAIGVFISVLMLVFDSFTAYEYAYNGKVLGYVKDQDEITDVLDIAGESLSQNIETEADVKFVANQNVTFNPVEARGKSIDDADEAVNKLVYMTDIETTGYAVFDGDKMVAVVKSSDEADRLLNETKTELSKPDPGMELDSSEFSNELSVKPIEVLLTSIQSNEAAKAMMIEGGTLELQHIIDVDETVESIATEYGVEPRAIFTDSNDELAQGTNQGDTVSIRIEVEPVSVKMVESGRMKETIKYETIKKETDEYYQGDTVIEQEGVDGVQIFTGTITKIGGKVTDRQESEPIEVITEKKDKIILVGTAERPKTAPTGTFAMPLDGNYRVTCEFGPRWGSTHKGFDLGAPGGTPIYASDGGEVIRAGWYGGYGNCIDIDHGRGYVTRYGHCSAIHVNVGDLVYQGQHIGNVGNTGFSFGNHLHFEVITDGVPKNPRPFLGM